MTCGIYCYIDKKDNSIVYVGKDSNIDKEQRNKQHRAPSQYNIQHFNRVLQNNPTRYTYQVLVWNVKDQDTLNALEIQYIRQLKPFFNFTEGGDGLLGYKHSEKTKQKLSIANKGKEPWIKGRHHSKKSKKKLSEVKKGQHHSEKTKKKMSKSRTNTGFYHVFKDITKKSKQGFTWRYTYYDKNNRRRTLSSVDFIKLSKKVKAKGLPWKIMDEEKAQKTLDFIKNE